MDEIRSEEVIWACWVLQAVFLGVATLIAGLSLPMYFEKIPPNRWYGIRTPKTLANKETWYRVNKIGAKYLFYACLWIVVLNLLFLGRFLCYPEHVAWIWIMIGGQLVIGDGALFLALGMTIFQTND